MIAVLKILVGIHARLGDTLLDIIIVHVFPNDRHLIDTDDLKETLILIAPRFRDTERDVHIRLHRHASRQTKTCRT